MPIVPRDIAWANDPAPDETSAAQKLAIDDEEAVQLWISQHEFLRGNNSPEEIKTFAREWTRPDAVKERTRRVFGADSATTSLIVWEIFNRSFLAKADPTQSEDIEKSIGGLVSHLVTQYKSEEFAALANLIEKLRVHNLTNPNESVWKTHAGRLILIWNHELKFNRLITKDEIWRRFCTSGVTMKPNKFYELLKKIGLNGLPGQIESESLQLSK